MGYKFNIFTGTLDLVDGNSGGTVVGVPPTTINAAARWDDTTGTTIKNSRVIIQDGGAIQTQALLQQRNIDFDVLIPDNYVLIDQDINITTGSITLDGDGEITLVD